MTAHTDKTVPVSTHHAMKTWSNGGKLHHEFLTLELNKREWLESRFGRIIFGKELLISTG